VQILVSPGVSLSEGEPSEIDAPKVHTEPLLISSRSDLTLEVELKPELSPEP